MATRLRATDLMQNEIAKTSLRQQSYARQLEACLDSIRHSTQLGGRTNTLYDVPYSVFGEPNYEFKECVDFLCNALTDSDFYVQRMIPGNRLYISWKVSDVEEVKSKKQKAENARKQKDQKQGNTILSVDPNNARSRAHFTAHLIKKADQESVRAPGERKANAKTTKKKR